MRDLKIDSEPGSQATFGWMIIILPLGILFTLRLLGFDGMVGQDSYAYVDFARDLREGKESLRANNFAWPEGYPLIGALVSLTGISVPFSLQLISCFSLSGSLIFLRKILVEIYPDSSEQQLFGYLLTFGLLSPYYLRSAMLTTPDILATFLIIAGIYWAGRYIKAGRFKDLILGTLVFTFAFYIRYVTVVLALPSALFILVKWLERNRNVKHFIVLLIPVTIILIGNFYGRHITQALGHGALQYWSPTNFFSTSFSTDQGYSSYSLPNMIYIFYPFAHYGFTLLGIPLILILMIRNKWRIEYLYIALLSYGTYAFFVAGMNAQNPRFLLPLVPLVLILCYYGYSCVSKTPFVLRFKYFMATFFIVMQILLCILSFRAIFKRNALEREITQALNDVNYEADLLYSFDIDIALESRGIPFKVINLWKNKLNAFQPGALVLFNEEKFAEQWRDKNPMKNWEMLNDKHHLALIRVFSNQWKLYRIGKKQ